MPTLYPKTVIAVFAYGNVWAQTLLCVLRDCSYAAYNTARYNLIRDMEKNGTKVDAPDSDGWPVLLHTPHQDALIDRARSICAKNFLEQTDSDVLLMVDHDMDWFGSDGKGYEGDLLHLVKRCHETQKIVGAVISKKARGQGVACLWKEPGTHELGKEGYVPVWYVGAGMTAYPRAALKAVVDHGVEIVLDGDVRRVKEIPPGFPPIYLPMVVIHPYAGHPGVPKDATLHLSEDWAFCHRARELGFESEVALRPLVTHYGSHGYTVVHDSQAGVDVAPVRGVAMDHPAIPRAHIGASTGPQTISLIHATRGRPEMALAAHELWLERASGDHNLEYILSVDDDDPSMANTDAWQATVKVVRGTSRGCVDAYNRGTHASSGSIIVQVHDDVETPDGWDRAIVEAIGDVTKPVLLRVSDGCPVNPSKPWLPTIAVMTRAFAEKVGGMWHPGYISVFCDDDLGQKAMKDGCFMAAPEIKFLHKWEGADNDETKRRSYQPKNWEHGVVLFEQRKAAGFPDYTGE